MTKYNNKAWLYLAPALVLLIVFMLYPLFDVFVYSFEEDYNSITKTFTGYGFHNYYKVLTDPYFVKALTNTFTMVIITVPLSTMIAVMIAYGLTQIKALHRIFQTIYFLPYVTNTIAVGLVFLILFGSNNGTPAFINFISRIFTSKPLDFINGTHAQKMFVMCFYIIWQVMPFKILVLVGAFESVPKTVYEAARVDGTTKGRIFRRITLPLVSPMISYLVITGFIGAFKEYNNAVALFGTNLDQVGMNTIVGYVYNQLYLETGGYPSYASSAAIILFFIVLTITFFNIMITRRSSLSGVDYA